MPLLIQSIAIGLVLSILGAELFGLSAAGLVVPGYLAYYMNQPLHLFVILLATVLTFLFEKIIAGITILYGRRLLAVDVLLSFVFVYSIELTISRLGLPIPFIMDSIGYFIPGLIVIYFGVNGILNTTLSVVLLALLVRIFMLGLSYLGMF